MDGGIVYDRVLTSPGVFRRAGKTYATCNYDRRGIPTAGPCPECGAVPAPSSQAST